VLWRTAIFIPVLLTGVSLGARRFLGTTPEAFRKATLILLTAPSVALSARAAISYGRKARAWALADPLVRQRV